MFDAVIFWQNLHVALVLRSLNIYGCSKRMRSNTGKPDLKTAVHSKRLLYQRKSSKRKRWKNRWPWWQILLLCTLLRSIYVFYLLYRSWTYKRFGNNKKTLLLKERICTKNCKRNPIITYVIDLAFFPSADRSQLHFSANTIKCAKSEIGSGED